MLLIRRGIFYMHRKFFTDSTGFYRQIFKLVLPIVIQNLLSAQPLNLGKVSGDRLFNRHRACDRR